MTSLSLSRALVRHFLQVQRVGLPPRIIDKTKLHIADARFDYSYESAGALQNIQIFSFEVGR